MAHPHQPTPDQLVDPELLLLNPRPSTAHLHEGSPSAASSSAGPATTDLGRRPPAPSYQHAYGDQHAHPQQRHQHQQPAAPPPQPLASSSSSTTTAAASRPTGAKRAGRSGPLKQTYVCSLCSPPVAFPTSAKKASHSQVVHQPRVRVTSDAGLYFYVDRDPSTHTFACPRVGCPHATPNTVSFGLHVRHTCRQPWPSTAPDPPEADLPRDEREEAEGGKRKRGGGRGKGKRRRGIEGAAAGAGGAGQEAGSIEELARALESALEVDESGSRENKALEDVPRLLGRLELARRTLGQRAEDVLARAAAGGERDEADGDGVDLGAVERAGDACGQLDDGGAAARAFVRWLVLSRLFRSPPSPIASPDPDAAQPDLNALAQVVLTALPFGDASNASLRTVLLGALEHADRSEPTPAAPPPAEADALAAALVGRARSLADAARAVPSSSPAAGPHPSPSTGPRPSSASPPVTAAAVAVAGGQQSSAVDRDHATGGHLAPLPPPAARAHPQHVGPPPAPAYPPATTPLLGPSYATAYAPEPALAAAVGQEAYYDPSSWAAPVGYHPGASALGPLSLSNAGRAYHHHHHHQQQDQQQQQQQQQGGAAGKDDIARLYQLAEEVALAQAAAAGEDGAPGPAELALAGGADDGGGGGGGPGGESGGRRTRRRVG